MVKYELKYEEIESIESVGKAETFDIAMKSPANNYIANGFVVHNSTGLSRLSQDLQIDNFKVLYDATALYRPGALRSGQCAAYISRRAKKKPIEYIHPLLEPFTKDTYGLILYQETVMQIMYEVGRFSWATAETTRKIMTKSQGREMFNRLRAEFVANAKREHNIPVEESTRIFNIVSTFGCLTGDTEIYRASSNQHKGTSLTIKEAFDYQKNNNFKHRSLKILAMSADGYVRPHKIKRIVFTGKKQVYFIKTSSGKTIKATEEHRFLVGEKWIPLKEISLGDYIRVTDLKLPKRCYGSGVGSGNHVNCPRVRKGQGITNEEKERKKGLMNLYSGCCQVCGSNKFVEMHHINKDKSDNSKRNTMLLCRKHHKELENANFARFQRGYYTYYDKVEEIIPSSLRETYDIEMDNPPRNFIANGFVVHNSYGFNRCISGDSKILVPVGRTSKRMKISDAYSKGIKQIYIFDSNLKKARKANIKEIIKTGKKFVFWVTCRTNRLRKIKTTMDHKFLTKVGWKRLKELAVGDEVMVSNPCEYAKIEYIGYAGDEETYDIEVDDPEHNYIAEMFVVHNSHSVEYSILSYWTAWLKTHYPFEFFSVLLSRETDDIQIANCINNMKKKGIPVQPPDINISDEKCKIYDGKVYLGLGMIKGLGSAALKKILSNRPYHNFFDFVQKKPPKGVWNALAKAGALDCFNKSRKLLVEQQDKLIKNPSLFSGEEWDEKTKMLEQLSVLSLPTEKPAIDYYYNPLKDKVPFEEIGSLTFNEYINTRWIKGIVSFINFKQEGLEGSWHMFDNILERRYAHLQVNDGTGDVFVHLSPEQYTYYKQFLEYGVGLPVVVRGHSIPGFNKVYCDALIALVGSPEEIEARHKLIIDYALGKAESLKETMQRKYPNSKVGIVDRVTYKVSKQKKAYARIAFSDGTFLIDTHLTPQIYLAGEVVVYEQQGNFLKEVVWRAEREEITIRVTEVEEKKEEKRGKSLF